MKSDNKCSYSKCGKELKFGIEKIVQTSERGIHGVYHQECYHEIRKEKLERIANELS